jgi:DNA polymerase III subunit delta
MDAIAFLSRSGRIDPRPVYVLHGDEDFLKHQVLLGLRIGLLGAEGDDFGWSVHAGDSATLAAIRNELETVPFFGPRRVVVVEAADPFVTRYRGHLEKYVSEASAAGVLVLEVKSWPATTRLAKLVDKASTILCKAPAAYRLPEWCVRWAESHHGKTLTSDAARLLVDLVGPEMGHLDQELGKLATYVGSAKRIAATDVDQLVGRSREENVFKILDAIANGESGKALASLDRLFESGENALRILGALSLQLRRVAQLARLNEQGCPPAMALNQVGVPIFARQETESQLRSFGQRPNLLYSWLLDTDLGAKGGSQLSPRILLERLLARLATESRSDAKEPPAGSRPPYGPAGSRPNISGRRGG